MKHIVNNSQSDDNKISVKINPELSESTTVSFVFAIEQVDLGREIEFEFTITQPEEDAI